MRTRAGVTPVAVPELKDDGADGCTRTCWSVDGTVPVRASGVSWG
jgi:hypothetical protein